MLIVPKGFCFDTLFVASLLTLFEWDLMCCSNSLDRVFSLQPGDFETALDSKEHAQAAQSRLILNRRITAALFV